MSLRYRLVRVRACLTVAALLAAGPALADKVAVLPFISVGNATAADLDAARAATRTAVLALQDTLPTDSEMLTAEMSAKDGVADTSQEYRAAGRASGSDWTVLGHVEEHTGTYRLEIEACDVASGRVESLAREVDASRATTQIKEMLALLLRPAGIGNADIPWEHAAPPPPPPPTPVKPEPAVTVVRPPPPPPPPSSSTPPANDYSGGHPFAAGLGIAGLGALQRSPMAVGSSAALLGEVALGYAPNAVPRLELRGNFAAALAGPGSGSFDLGARYAIPIAPSVRLCFGPEADLGGFFTTGGDKTGRFLVHGAVFASVGVGEHLQVEVAGDLEYAAGGATALVLGGGTARALARF
jgi:hypothetical protein